MEDHGRLKKWEIRFIVLFCFLFCGALYSYFTGGSVLRSIFFDFEDVAGLKVIGRLSAAKGGIRRQKSVDNEFQIPHTGDSIFNSDTVVTGPDSQYYALPIVIAAHSGYHMFGHFLNKLESGNLLFMVHDLRIEDTGNGIAVNTLHRATLERGFTTAGSMGHGFWMMLKTADRVWLLTGAGGTTVVIEQDRAEPDPAWLQGRL